MKTSKFLRTILIVIPVIFLASCELNDDENFPDPTYPDPIISVGDITELNLGVAQLINIPNLNVEGAVGITNITISENGNVLESQNFNGTSGVVNSSFTFQVPEAWFNTTRQVVFTARDTQNNVGQTAITVNISEIVPQYTIEDVTLNGQAFKRITGIINFDETLDSSSLWIISGQVEVFQQTTLTILEGTQIYAETEDTRLEVNQLGLVDWQGTATNPIVFNALANAPGQGAGNTDRGQWSGIGIEGAGGNDNSGIVRYVRLMYPGSNDDSIQFTNAGDQTVAEYIQVYRPGDNGIRVNDGTINLKYMVSTDPFANEAGIRWSENWDGSGQFWVVNMLEGSEAIQGRQGSGFLSNITITGSAFNNSSANPTGRGFRIRNGGTAKIYNAVITGVDTSIRFSNGSEQGVVNGESFFANSASFNNEANNGTGFHSTTDFFNPTDNDYIPTFNNSVTPFTIVDSYVGTDTTNSTSAGALDPFFDDVNYVGAVEVGNDWTLGWCVNIDGTPRN
ncbi:hypothetical protein [Winogradskyella sp.]|uniref:hypothetical protein n=1 Tax=Winogradskyella sp. TaxID=1883156 RepID=UPI002610F6C5|nr:hypothetical protein [Winogradskyella sp.]